MATEKQNPSNQNPQKTEKKHGKMGKRGVTRPMSDMKMDGGNEMMMDSGQRKEMLIAHHKQTLWVYWVVILLGVWMIFSPLTFDYGNNVVSPSGGRDVWLSLADRIAAMRWSDIISGFLLIFFGWRSLKPNRPYSVWIACFVGIWISMAQLGYVDYAWDPFFGDGTLNVLNSDMSHSWPVSDAALGSFAYTLEFLMGFMGATSRWRTMPWMVTFFGILVIPLGFVSIFLVVSQPLTVGAWCSLCLFTAAVMLPMIPLQIDEVIAMGQHMVQRKRKGDSLWKVFWKGGDAITTKMDERSPGLVELHESPWKVFKSSIWGMTAPWQLTVATILGLWVMFSPTVFGVGIETRAADLNHLGGALVVVMAVVAMAEVLRTFRYLNVLLGLALIVLPWFIADGNMSLSISSSISGFIIILLSFSKGIIREKYGLWDKYIK